MMVGLEYAPATVVAVASMPVFAVAILGQSNLRIHGIAFGIILERLSLAIRYQFALGMILVIHFCILNIQKTEIR